MKTEYFNPWCIVDAVPDACIGYRAIVTYEGTLVCNPSPMGEANARLIAAAPDLLLALQKIDANAAESAEWIRRVAREAIAHAINGVTE